MKCGDQIIPKKLSHLKDDCFKDRIVDIDTKGVFVLQKRGRWCREAFLQTWQTAPDN